MVRKRSALRKIHRQLLLSNVFPSGFKVMGLRDIGAANMPPVSKPSRVCFPNYVQVKKLCLYPAFRASLRTGWCTEPEIHLLVIFDKVFCLFPSVFCKITVPEFLSIKMLTRDLWFFCRRYPFFPKKLSEKNRRKPLEKLPFFSPAHHLSGKIRLIWFGEPPVHNIFL